METLTSGQYDLVSNLMSLTVAAMGAEYRPVEEAVA